MWDSDGHLSEVPENEVLTTPLASGSDTEEISDYSQYNDADEVTSQPPYAVAARLAQWSMMASLQRPLTRCGSRCTLPLALIIDCRRCSSAVAVCRGLVDGKARCKILTVRKRVRQVLLSPAESELGSVISERLGSPGRRLRPHLRRDNSIGLQSVLSMAADEVHKCALGFKHMCAKRLPRDVVLHTSKFCAPHDAQKHTHAAVVSASSMLLRRQGLVVLTLPQGARLGFEEHRMTGLMHAGSAL